MCMEGKLLSAGGWLHLRPEGAVPGLCEMGKIGLGELQAPVSLSQAAYLLPLAWAGAECFWVSC